MRTYILRRRRRIGRIQCHPSHNKSHPIGWLLLWLGWPDSDRRMPESKSGALPLGYTPISGQRNRAAGALFSVAQSLYHIPLRLSRCTGVFFMPSGERMPKRRGCWQEPGGGQTCVTVGNRPGERSPTARRTERRNPAGKGAVGKHPMAGLRADGSINRWQAERPAARQPGRQSGTKGGGLRMAAMRKNGPPGGAPGAPARRAAGSRQEIKGRRTRTRLPASGPDPGIRSGRARKKDPAS